MKLTQDNTMAKPVFARFHGKKCFCLKNQPKPILFKRFFRKTPAKNRVEVLQKPLAYACYIGATVLGP